MRNLFALLFVAAAFTFVACEKKGGEQGSADSLAKDSAVQEVAPVAPAADSVAKDSAAAPAAVDTAAKKK